MLACAATALVGCNSNTRVDLNNNASALEHQRTTNAKQAEGSGGAMGLLGFASLDGARAQINDRVDEWHNAAAIGDADAYFGTLTDNAIFLGTDKTERWTLEQFRTAYGSYFDGPTTYGDGAWTYEPLRRFVTVHESGRLAWFDEVLHSASYGHCRGTGVIVLEDDNRWRIAHYSLTFLIPNDVARAATTLGIEHEASTD